jgi:hypothetical protein
MSAAEESAQWHAWQREQVQQRLAASEVREAAGAAAEEAERQARIEAKRDHDFEAFRARMTGEPPRTLGAVLHDLASVPDRPWWDPEAEPGSERNPVRLGLPQPGGAAVPAAGQRR